MKTYPLLIPKNIILPISILGLILTVIGTLMKLNHWNFGAITPNMILGVSTIFSLIALFVVIIDITRNPLKNKFLWIVPLFFTGNIVTIIYLINREAHLRRALR